MWYNVHRFFVPHFIVFEQCPQLVSLVLVLVDVVTHTVRTCSKDSSAKHPPCYHFRVPLMPRSRLLSPPMVPTTASFFSFPKGLILSRTRLFCGACYPPTSNTSVLFRPSCPQPAQCRYIQKNSKAPKPIYDLPF